MLIDIKPGAKAVRANPAVARLPPMSTGNRGPKRGVSQPVINRARKKAAKAKPAMTPTARVPKPNSFLNWGRKIP
ncbi:hypothetical protein OF122_07115 [Pelagibacterium flavum]|uniref:Uncharacterized protein n=1 Tax=Pelagibacterium flavum TaxID=2984530 RepID=A0ABY6ISA9_9HYPH|nr:hypothetical protein [Pelagibacterium sp. YIM 151497]UYQ73517.1 hypothetical protein OF122_07115 [Pelagibacterium sp. YIM 151497]